MVTVARLLNLTLVVPELDKTSFWADTRYKILSYVFWLIDLVASNEYLTYAYLLAVTLATSLT